MVQISNLDFPKNYATGTSEPTFATESSFGLLIPELIMSPIEFKKIPSLTTASLEFQVLC